MQNSLFGPELVAVLVLVVGVLVGLLLLVVFLLVAYLVWRRSSTPKGPTREDMLRDLGFVPGSAAGTWSRPLQGTNMIFSDKKGWRWTIRLPRYNTLTLQVEERESGIEVPGRVFESEKPALDRRFVMASELAAQTVALVANGAVSNAMLDMKWLSLHLKGDELILDDPEAKNLGGATKDTPAAVEAERAAHLGAVALVTAMFRTMYSAQTGTIMPEYR